MGWGVERVGQGGLKFKKCVFKALGEHTAPPKCVMYCSQPIFQHVL